jgi:hypothetical protein
VRLFSLPILTDKIVLVVQSCKVPTPPISWDGNPRLPNHQRWLRTLNPNCQSAQLLQTELPHNEMWKERFLHAWQWNLY